MQGRNPQRHAARRWLTPLVCALLVGASAVTPAFAATPRRAAASAESAHFQTVAAKGIAAAHKRWWNGGQHWYNDRLGGPGVHPLATIWSIVPLFEAIDAQAIGAPTHANRAAVRAFAKQAERYWNPNVAPYGAFAPYRGDRIGTERTWFDDNGWWGLAFVDAYRATQDRRYLDDAKRALRFIDARGWDGGHGMWWNTSHPHHSLEALSSGAALAAELYEQTGNDTYRRLARKYVRWAERHATHENKRHLYATAEQSIMSYVEGAMIGAHLALCRSGDEHACRRAEEVAQACFEKWEGQSPDHAPQFDTILMRYVLQLGDYDHDPTWYEWVRRVAERAEERAHVGGLFLHFWDGSKPTSHGDGAGGFDAGMLQTHAATVSLFAWLGATERPPGEPRPLPDGAISHPGWGTSITVERRHEGSEPLCYIQGHLYGYTSKRRDYKLTIALDDGGRTDTRNHPGTTEAGKKVNAWVTILKRHLERADHPIELTVTAKVEGKTYRSTKQLDAPWC